MNEVEEKAITDVFFAFQEERRQQLIQERLDRLAGKHVEPPLETKSTWEYMNSDDLNVIISRAKELGWAENKVQVKVYYLTPEKKHYYLEPFEENCNCMNLLKYEDFID